MQEEIKVEKIKEAIKKPKYKKAARHDKKYVIKFIRVH